MVVGVGSRHIIENFLEITDKQGWQGLWAGNTINMLRIVPTQAIELATFEWVKRTVSSAQENWTQNGGPKVQVGQVNLDLSLSWVSPVAVGGAAAGIVSTLICHPLEVIKVIDLVSKSPRLTTLGVDPSIFFSLFYCDIRTSSWNALRLWVLISVGIPGAGRARILQFLP